MWTTADRIGREVEEVGSKQSEIKCISLAPLIRELVNAKLLEHGLEDIRRQHTRLGMPIYDVEQLILQQNKENANIPHGPEATNLTLAETIKKGIRFSDRVRPGYRRRPHGGGHSSARPGLYRPAVLFGAVPGIYQEIRSVPAQRPVPGQAGPPCRGASGAHGQIRGGPAVQFCRSHRLGRGQPVFRARTWRN